MRAQAFAQTRLHAKLGLVQLYVNSEDIQAAYHLLLEVKNQYPDTAGISQQLEIIESLAKLNYQTKV
jgi:thioredoxin-like negative regulator of GroEL